MGPSENREVVGVRELERPGDLERQPRVPYIETEKRDVAFFESVNRGIRPHAMIERERKLKLTGVFEVFLGIGLEDPNAVRKVILT